MSDQALNELLVQELQRQAEIRVLVSQLQAGMPAAAFVNSTLVPGPSGTAMTTRPILEEAVSEVVHNNHPVAQCWELNPNNSVNITHPGEARLY